MTRRQTSGRMTTSYKARPRSLERMEDVCVVEGIDSCSFWKR